MNRTEVIQLLRSLLQRFPTQKDAADELGLSAQYINDVLHRRRKPGKKMLRALKLRPVEAYERL